MKKEVPAFPEHVAIIMDGNGRWAKKRHLPRLAGHKAGVSAVERTVRAASRAGIKHLSLYAFSNENWKRPELEVKGLMKLFKRYISIKASDLARENVRLRFAGKRDKLPTEVTDLMDSTMNKTAHCDGMELVICLNYGGRQEIIDSIHKILAEDNIPEIINENYFRQFLYLPHLPDPDLIIRTSGELRLSNFWLWQSSYSELYFSNVLWPDFGKEQLEKALEDYAGRKRRYGNI